MITEDYVSFETAKLLREKGLNGLCTAYYDCFTTDNFHCGNEPTDFNSIDTKIRNIVAAPTLQMAMKWLREVHSINPVPYALSLGWAFEVFDLSNRDITGCKKLYSMDFPSKSEVYNTYEKACDAAIKYCLENLI